MIDYAKKYLEQRELKLRGEYKEFLELVIIFLGDVPARAVRFMKPGAIHHARWMSEKSYIVLRSGCSKLNLNSISKKRKDYNICAFSLSVFT